jgi:hypothetical protein
MPPAQTLRQIEQHLTSQYGYLMSTKEVAEALKMKSPGEVRTARSRGVLALKPVDIRRRSQYYSTVDVAALLARIVSSSAEEHAM